MSKQAHGIDVYGPPLRYRNLSQETSWILAAKDDLPAKPASNPLDKNRGRPNKRDIHAPGISLLFKELMHPLGFPLALGIAGIGVEEACQSAKGRVRVLATKGDFLPIKGGVVVLGGTSDGIVLRVVTLHNDMPRQRSSTCPARNLTQDLEGALAGSEIGEMEANVGINHPHQGNKG